MSFWPKKRVGKVNERLLLHLGVELMEKSSVTEGTGHLFIHPDDARAVLRREDVKDLFSSLSWYQEDDRTALWHNMCLILCILISMRWRDWNDFKTYFYYPGQGLKRPRFTDKDLPIKKDELLEQLPPSFSKRFLEYQYRFVPIIIMENSHLKYSTDYRLPILKAEPLRDAEGAQGVVEKVHIERSFLYYDNQTFNHSPQVMAFKRMAAKTAGKLNFDMEQRILQQFKLCITHHDRIMRTFASFIHGSDLILLSPWADGRDLHLFLTRPAEVLDNYMARSIRFSPDNLLMESYNLARALNFLHHELVSPRGKRLRCAHLDLKPQNVLVSFPRDDRLNEAPVGRWKFSDFDVSKVEEIVTEGRVIPAGKDDQAASMAPGNIARMLSIQPPTRGAGTFQPPEVQNIGPVKVSTRRDVWSYGCILAMVLAFALGGPEEVKAQTRRRDVKGVDDCFYRRTHQRSRSPGPSPELMTHNVDAELKPALRRWIEHASRLADVQHEHWIQHTSNLILTLLDVDVTTRPEISVAVDTLNIVTESTERLARHRLWELDGYRRLPEPPVVPPLEHPQNHPGFDPTFLGHVPPPSASYNAPRQRSLSPDSKRSSGALSSIFDITSLRVRDHSPPSSGSYTADSRESKRSSGAFNSIFSRDDPSQSFARLVVPHKCQGATIEPSGQAAAFWSVTDVKLYNLSLLNADPNFWSERPVKRHTEADALFIGGISLLETSICKKVQLAGNYLALLEQLADSSYWVHLYSRDALQQAQFTLPLSQAPEDFKLSSFGTLALRFHGRVGIRTKVGSTSIPLEKEFGGMAFTGGGEYFCLWERDTREKGKAKTGYNYWTVWSQDTSAAAEFKIVGQTIRIQLPPNSPERATGESFLAPFSTYPHFIACDRQQYVYIVRADLQTARAHLLCQIDNAVASFGLPDDETFVLIRGSQQERQRAERCFLGSPSLQIMSCGKLHENINIESDGAAVVPDQSGRCLLTLKPSGLLVRKFLGAGIVNTQPRDPYVRDVALKRFDKAAPATEIPSSRSADFDPIPSAIGLASEDNTNDSSSEDDITLPKVISSSTNAPNTEQLDEMPANDDDGDELSATVHASETSGGEMDITQYEVTYVANRDVALKFPRTETFSYRSADFDLRPLDLSRESAGLTDDRYTYIHHGQKSDPSESREVDQYPVLLDDAQIDMPIKGVMHDYQIKYTSWTVWDAFDKQSKVILSNLHLITALYGWKIRKLFRPKPKPGFHRFEWTCSCGKWLSGDYMAETQDDVQEMQEFLNSFATGTGNPQSSGLSAGQPAASASTTAVSTASTLLNSTAPANQNSILSQRTSTSTSSPVPTVFPLDVPAFFELCVRRNSRLTRLGEIMLTDAQCRRRVRSDKELFTEINNRYNALKRKGIYQLLRRPVNIEYVLFSTTGAGSQVGIARRPLEIPEPEQVLKTREYHYFKCPMKDLPPMDHESFFHYLWDHVPSPQCDRADWFQRMPKKLGMSMIHSNTPGLQWGFGVLIVEGLNKTFLSWVIVLVLLSSLTAGVTYGKRTGDMSTGFSIASYIVTVLGSAMAAIYYTVTER